MSRRRKYYYSSEPTKMDGCITIAGWILIIVGIILCVVGYNTLNGLLLLIGIAAVAVGVGLTFWLAAS